MAREEELTAYHEAGLMLAAWMLGLTVRRATIVPDPESGNLASVTIPVENRLRNADWVDEREYLRAHLVTYYAGIAASELYTGMPMSEIEVQVAVE
jgi:ATP-dependent Zn protease